MQSIYQKIKTNLDSLLCNKKSILIALSGGKDSMTLLHLLLNLKVEYKLNLSIAYINHNLRGKDSDKEKIFVTEYINKIGLPLYTFTIKKEYWKNLKNESIEMAARKCRYDFFNKIANENNIDYIATAHNFNDKIETFFLNIFRAGGTDTFKSIPMKNKKIIRPLVTITRDEIDEYIIKNSIPFIEDSTNKKNTYKRNKIRNKLLPIFREIHPNYEKSFTHVFSFINEEQKLLNHLTLKNYKNTLLYKSNSSFCLDNNKYSRLPIVIKKKLIKLVLKKLNYPASLSMRLLTTLSGNKKKYIYKKNNFYCKGSGKYLWFINLSRLNNLKEKITVNNIPFEYKKNSLFINIQKKTQLDPKKQFSFRCNDSFFPLTIRGLSNDDILFISSTTKKLIKNLLKDLKIPEPLYKEVIIIETNDKRIIGFSLNNFYRVSPEFYVKDAAKENAVFEVGCCF